MLKREQAKMNAILKQLLAKDAVEPQRHQVQRSVDCNTLKAQLGKLQDTQENEGKQHAADMKELKDWVNGKVEGLAQDNALHEALQTLHKLQKNMDIFRPALSEEGVLRQKLGADIKVALLDQDLL